MIQHLDAALDKYLRDGTRLPTEDVAISFDAPTGEWSTSVTLPTISLFLWDLSLNQDESAAGQARTRAASEATSMGRVRMTARYVASVWTNDVKDEHELLGRVFAAVVSEPFLRDDLLTADELRISPAPVLRIGTLDERARADFWSGFGSRPRASIDLSVSLTVDPPTVLAGESVDSIRIETPEHSVRRRAGKGPADRFSGVPITSSSDVAVIDEFGKFLIEAKPGERITAFSSPPVTVRVPEAGPIELS